MLTSKLFINKTAELGFVSLLLLLAGIAYGDAALELEKGEEVVVLNVQHMT